MHGFWISSTEPLNFSAAQRAFAVIEQREAILAVRHFALGFRGHAEAPIATRPHRRVQQLVLKWWARRSLDTSRRVARSSTRSWWTGAANKPVTAQISKTKPRDTMVVMDPSDQQRQAAIISSAPISIPTSGKIRVMCR